MRMICFTIAMLMLTDVNAQPVDAPLAVIDQSQVYDIQEIRAGELSPLTGRVMDDRTYIALAQRIASSEAERDALKSSPIQGAWVALLAIGALGVGVTLGAMLGARLRGN